MDTLGFLNKEIKKAEVIWTENFEKKGQTENDLTDFSKFFSQ